MKKRIFALIIVLVLTVSQSAFAKYNADGSEDGMFKVIDLGEYKIAFTNRLGTGIRDTYWYRNCGVFDKDGNVVVEPIYDGISAPCDGRSAFSKDGMIGFFDENWQIAIEPQYVLQGSSSDIDTHFSEGLCAIGKKSDTQTGHPYKHGYIDRDGNTVIDFIYDEVEPFENGIAEVGIDEYVYNYSTKTKYGKIDKNGNIVEPFKFSYATNSDRGDYYDLWQEDKLDVVMSINLVDINGRRYKNSDIEYPFINYAGFSYIPLTYYGCRMMGINCDWTPETGLVLSGDGEVSEDITGYNGMKNGVYQKAEVYKGRLTVNGKVYEYGDTAYPLITFRNIVYMPVLWQTGMEALGIEYSFLRADQLENSVDGCMVFKTN